MSIPATSPVAPCPPSTAAAVGTGTPGAASGWSRPMELGLAFLLGCVALGLGQQVWLRAGVSSQPAIMLTLPPIDVNAADEATLAQVPGLGAQRAKRIIEYRQRHGHFRALDELDQVEGLGQYTVEKIRPALRVGLNEQALGAVLPRATRPGETYDRTAPLDLNSAPVEQLQQLPGIGPVLAQRIVQDRETRGTFQKLEDLARIHGIKGKTIEKLRPFVVVRPLGRVVPPRDPT